MEMNLINVRYKSTILLSHNVQNNQILGRYVEYNNTTFYNYIIIIFIIYMYIILLLIILLPKFPVCLI